MLLKKIKIPEHSKPPNRPKEQKIDQRPKEQKQYPTFDCVAVRIHDSVQSSHICLNFWFCCKNTWRDSNS